MDKKGKKIQRIIYLHIKRLQIFLRIFDLQALQYVKQYFLCINYVPFGIIIIIKVF